MGGRCILSRNRAAERRQSGLDQFHSLWRQNGLRLSHCLKVIPQIPCLLSAQAVVDSVTLAVNGTKHFCQQIKPCWNIKKTGPNRVGMDSCLVFVSFWGAVWGAGRVTVPRQWDTYRTVAIGESHWVDFYYGGKRLLKKKKQTFNFNHLDWLHRKI